MSFGENLQFLRRRQDMTQEALAEQLGVSRQSVSKWESDGAYPEMATIIQLCDLFSVDMDTLLRQDVRQALAEDTTGYDKHMNTFSIAIAAGVGLILAGVTVMMFLLAGSRSDADAAVYPIIGTSALLVFIAVAVAIFIISGKGHDRFKRKHPFLQPFYTEEQFDAFERRFPLFIALPVVLILIGVIFQVAIVLVPELSGSGNQEQWALTGTSILLFCVTVAVTVIVWAGIQKDKYDIEKYNRQCQRELDPTPEQKRLNRIIGALWGIGMILATALYLTLGFTLDLWKWAAVIYPVASLLFVAVTIFLRRNEED